MSDERFLVTGAAGCLGAWTVARLIAERTPVVAFDASDDGRRLRLLIEDNDLAGLTRIRGDIRNLDEISGLIDTYTITHIVHLAALQVPFCKADPVLGSEVNVTGTVNVLEAVRRADGLVRGLVYASSAAAFGTAAHYRGGIASDNDLLLPATLYGVYKQANEGTARVYAADWGVGSVGLRPCIVYGPGRDQGLTSDPTKVMLAAAAGRSGHIAFGGSSTFHHADDVAAAFIAAARLEVSDALVHNIGGTDASVAEVATAVERSVPGTRVTFEDEPLPLPAGVDGSPLAALLGVAVQFRSLERGVADSVDHFRRLLDRGLLTQPD